MFGDPIMLLVDWLREDFPDAIVETRLSPKALSSDKYIFIQETGGTTRLSYAVDAPIIEVICYGKGGRGVMTSFARDVQSKLYDYLHEQRYSSNGSLCKVETIIRPSPQPVNGLPFDITRVFSSYQMSVRPPFNED